MTRLQRRGRDQRRPGHAFAHQGVVALMLLTLVGCGDQRGVVPLPDGGVDSGGAVEVDAASAPGAAVNSGPARLVIEPSEAHFGAVCYDSFRPITVRVTNAGGSVSGLLDVAATEHFDASNSCSGKSLAGGASCDLRVFFRGVGMEFPGGRLVGKVVVEADPGGQIESTVDAIVVSGQTAELVPNRADFGAQAVGTATATQSFTLKNFGSLPIDLTGWELSVDFLVTNDNCKETLDPGAGCDFQVAFKPRGPGPRTGTLKRTVRGCTYGFAEATLTGQGI